MAALKRVLRRAGCGFSVVLPVLFFGCGEDVVKGKAPATKGSAAPAGSVAADLTGDAGVPKFDIQENEFLESERSRDPFRSYAGMFAEEARSRVKSQREVVLDQYSLDELKLVGIVTRIQPAKAMLVDPSGKGHVIRRGQFVGRPEIVQAASSGAGASYEINWRVDRIRDGDIVLIREDPANPDVPSATRVIALRPEGTVIGE